MFSLVNVAHAAEGISVKLSPYVIGEVFGVPITATMMTVWLSMLLLVAIAITLKAGLKLIPGKFQSLTELLIGGAYNYVVDTLESKKLAQTYFPIIMTIFLLVLVMNWVGLLPGVTSIGFFEGYGKDSRPRAWIEDSCLQAEAPQGLPQNHRASSAVY